MASALQSAIGGVVLADVDDLLQGGGTRHDAKKPELRARLTFGSWRSGQGEYLGRTVAQGKENDIDESFRHQPEEEAPGIRGRYRG